MAADSQSGRADVAGFAAAFAARGRRRWPTTVRRRCSRRARRTSCPILTQAKASGAKAVYAFYVGAQATSFVQQYAQSDARDLPLFGPGFLTEGRVLAAQGRAAVGVRTALNYAPDLDNPTNRRFVDAWRARYNSLPTAYAMASWDAALPARQGDRRGRSATRARRPSTPPSTRIGLIDSPRGEWQFSDPALTGPEVVPAAGPGRRADPDQLADPGSRHPRRARSLVMRIVHRTRAGRGGRGRGWPWSAAAVGASRRPSRRRRNRC